MRLGREDEAMAELKSLRPLLSRSADAVLYISETLEECGVPRSPRNGWLRRCLRQARQEMLESQ